MRKLTLVPCRYCRVRTTHLDVCPKGDADAIRIWEEGFEDGKKQKVNARAGDRVYTLGFVSGEIERERLNTDEGRAPRRSQGGPPAIRAIEKRSASPMCRSRRPMIVRT